MTKQQGYLYTCDRCAPEGLSVEEYATRPLAAVCFVCGEEAQRWYTSAERVLKALLRERMRDRAERNSHDIQNRCVGCADYRRKGAKACGNCGQSFAETNQRDASEVVPAACPPELLEAGRNAFLPLRWSNPNACSTVNGMNKAPWKDFGGADIHEGDVIAHPDGMRGTVMFLRQHSEASDQWRVDYHDGGPVSRLCLQIGDKGQAVVVERATFPAKASLAKLAGLNEHGVPDGSLQVNRAAEPPVPREQRIAQLQREIQECLKEDEPGDGLRAP